MPTVTMFGLKNCDTVKKARAWLEAHGIAYAFHDFKTAGLHREQLGRWAARVGWEALLNRAGTTFRKLPEADKADLTEASALPLLLAHPSMIKRPVLEHGADLLVGFSPEKYGQLVAGEPA